MAGIIALRSSKNLNEAKKLVMIDFAVQERLLDAVKVPLQRRILDRSEEQKLSASRLGAVMDRSTYNLQDRSEKQKLVRQ